jgi:hypothetical protein
MKRIILILLVVTVCFKTVSSCVSKRLSEQLVYVPFNSNQFEENYNEFDCDRMSMEYFKDTLFFMRSGEMTYSMYNFTNDPEGEATIVDSTYYSRSSIFRIPWCVDKENKYINFGSIDSNTVQQLSMEEKGVTEILIAPFYFLPYYNFYDDCANDRQSGGTLILAQCLGEIKLQKLYSVDEVECYKYVINYYGFRFNRVDSDNKYYYKDTSQLVKSPKPVVMYVDKKNLIPIRLEYDEMNVDYIDRIPWIKLKPVVIEFKDINLQNISKDSKYPVPQTLLEKRYEP